MDRRSAFSTSGLLHHPCGRTGSVTAVLCANSGRFAGQGKPPTVAIADLCQRPKRQPTKHRLGVFMGCRDNHSIQQEPGRAFVVQPGVTKSRARAMGLDRRPRAPLSFLRSRLLLTLAPPCRVSPAPSGNGYFYHADEHGAGASPPEATGDSCISYAHHAVDDLG